MTATMERPGLAAPPDFGALLPLPGRITPRAAIARIVGAGLLVVGVFTMPDKLSWAGPTYALCLGLIVALAVLSVSVLGWIGEFSLATLAQMGMGVVVLNFCQEHDVPFPVIVPLAIAYFAYAVVGGLGSIGGAIGAGLVFGSLPRYLETASGGKFVGYDLFFAAAVSLVIILFVPGGIAALGRRIWTLVEGPPRAHGRAR
jgi:hypothetical protein